MRRSTISSLIALGLGAVASAMSCSSEFKSCEFSQECASQRTGGAGGEGGTGGGGDAGAGMGGDAGAGTGGSACSTPCLGDTPLCNEDSGQCVDCNTTDDCDDGVCDLTAHRCVECTRETEEEQCGQFSCSSLTQTCTTTLRGNRDTCDPCEADSECITGRRCVLHTFAGDEVGHFCFLEQGTVGCGNTVPERRPYRRPVDLTSIDNVDATYCLPPVTTTCQGIRDTQSKACDASDECGVEGLNDGYCPDAGTGQGACSYLCDGGFDCGGTLECAGTPQHCRPQP